MSRYEQMIAAAPITADPPLHGWTRRMLLPAFAPRAVTRWEGYTEELCHELIDGFIESGQCDGAVDYSQQIPPRVIANLMGINPDDADQFVEIKRFRQVFERAALVGRDGVLEIRVRGDNNDRQLGVFILQALEERNAAHARHTNIGNQDVRRRRVDGVEQVLPTFEAARFDARLPERFLEYPSNRLVVVDNPRFERMLIHAFDPDQEESERETRSGRVGFRTRSNRRDD